MSEFLDQAGNLAGFFKRKDALEEELEQVMKDIRKWSALVLDQMIEHGVNNLKVNGRTLYLQERLWAHCTDIDALKAYPDVADLVKESVNTQSLSSWVRDEVKEGRISLDDEMMPILPPEIKSAINLSQVVKLCARKSN
jgi:hypothetical protein